MRAIRPASIVLAAAAALAALAGCDKARPAAGNTGTPSGCTLCHGSTANAAPPTPTSATNGTVKVGAHQAHLTGTTLRSTALGCADCHAVPNSVSHSTGTVDMTWGALARTGGLTPSPGNLGGATQTAWEASPTCTNYCHGGGFAAAVKGSVTSPTWTGTAATSITCASCHQAPPATADHASVTGTTNCSSCHEGYDCTTANLPACTVNKASHLNGTVDKPSLTCSACHGSPANAAPPAATSTANAAVKVGAHQAHLVKSNLRSAVLTCADCHTVPTTIPHASGVVDMTWGTLAKTGGLTPTPANLGPATSPSQATWEASPTCTNYCHGAAFVAAAAGSATSPSWTGAAVSTACGSCHQAPPATPDHTSVTSTTNCGTCHDGYSCTAANLAACTVNKATHLNGVVDQPTLACVSCHGSTANAAPPVDTNRASTGIRVGAHQAHLTKTNLRSTVLGCADCHTVPTSTSHATGTVDMTWGTLAKTGGLTPTPGNLTGAARTTWEATPTCANYCHGAGFAAAVKGSGTAPSWTGAAVGTACDACHQAPPATAAHASVTGTTNCGACHSGYSCTTTNLAACTVNKAIHLNGVVDAPNLSCSSCHGSPTNAAPPAATSTTNAAVKVGAHQAHLAKANLRSAVLTCGDCHTVPGSTSHASGTVDMTWGALAKTGGLTPAPGNLNATAQATWEAAPTCTNYCHGAGFAAASAGSGVTASWTGAAVNTACGSCHQAPPATADHATVTSATNCGGCHAGYSCTTANLAACTVNKATHLNGVVETPSLSCTSCHGSAANAAPPIATTTVNAATKVGAHQAHLVKTNLRAAALGCADCHTVPSSTSHSSGTVDMTWGALAKTGGLTPTPGNLNAAAQATWEASPTCANYCHGAGFDAAHQGTGATPSWTGAAVATACGACHKAPPSSTAHAKVTASTNCGGCHPGYSCTTANLAACTVNKTTHLNGSPDFSVGCTSCHGNAALTATAASPLNAAPPVDTAGLATGGVKIGAHQRHLTGTTYVQTPIACAACHAGVATYTTSHSNGTSNVGFSGNTIAALRTGTWTASSGSTTGSCASTWCHGNGIGRGGASAGGTLTTPKWTDSITACTACHGLAPNTGRHNTHVSNGVGCGSCHPGYTSTAVNKATHLNGVKDVGGSITAWNSATGACTGCHGSDSW